MIRVGDLTLFSRLEGDKLAPFASDRPRTVRLTFNAPHRTVINVVPMFEDGTFPDEDPIFLAVVDGLEEVEFYAQGAFAIQAEADLVYLKSVDGNAIHAVVPDAVTYTRIAERRARNPEIEALQAMLLKNQERRMGAMFEEVRIERQRLERDRETFNSGARPAGGDKPAPEPAPRTGEPAASSAPAPAGNEGGKSDA